MAAEADRAARNSDLSYEAHVLVDTVLSRAASSVLTMVTALNQRLRMPLSEAGLSALDARVIKERRSSKAGAAVQRSSIVTSGANQHLYLCCPSHQDIVSF